MVEGLRRGWWKIEKDRGTYGSLELSGTFYTIDPHIDFCVIQDAIIISILGFGRETVWDGIGDTGTG
jgi:hypothetical protein